MAVCMRGETRARALVQTACAQTQSRAEGAAATRARAVDAALDALRQGFNAVFPMDRLGAFTPAEMRTLLCGDQDPVFTREEIMRYTEPKLGYTKESPGFIK